MRCFTYYIIVSTHHRTNSETRAIVNILIQADIVNLIMLFSEYRIQDSEQEQKKVYLHLDLVFFSDRIETIHYTTRHNNAIKTEERKPLFTATHE